MVLLLFQKCGGWKEVQKGFGPFFHLTLAKGRLGHIWGNCCKARGTGGRLVKTPFLGPQRGEEGGNLGGKGGAIGAPRGGD